MFKKLKSSKIWIANTLEKITSWWGKKNFCLSSVILRKERVCKHLWKIYCVSYQVEIVITWQFVTTHAININDEQLNRHIMSHIRLEFKKKIRQSTHLRYLLLYYYNMLKPHMSDYNYKQAVNRAHLKYQ